MPVSLAALPIAIWLYLLLGRQWFWWIQPFHATPPAGADTKRIAVVIPARDEAGSIARVVETWAGQQYQGPLVVFLVDDHSSDGTADIARQSIGDSARFQLLTAPEKPPLWTGKLWAVVQGISAARDFSPDYFLFTDADIVHAPDTLRALIDRAEHGRYDLVSLMARLHCKTLAEKALIPAFVFFFFLLYPPRSMSGAAGGCMLVRRGALERAGGIEAIHDAVIDDCALAAAIKSTGGRVSLAPADASVSLRVYATFGEIGHMISRTAYTQLRYSPWLLSATLLGLFVTYLLPVGMTIFGHGAPRAAGIAAWLLMSIAYAPTLRYYRLPIPWALTLPAIALFYAGATLHSAIRGSDWKGRRMV